MKRIVIVSLFICVLPLGFASPLCAKSRSAHAFRSRAGVRSDGEYIIALGVANQFLHAWQTQDHEAGLMMLTDEAKQHTTEERLQEFFSAEADTQQAFEISHGKKVKSGRYEFPVALLEVVPGKGNAVHRRFSQITVTRAGKNDWAVDNLP